jgi:hypothetical protein
MDTPQPQEQPQGQPEQKSPQDKARSQVALAMFLNGKMTDAFIPPDQFKMFLDKTFAEWPKELQDKLRPFGAEMIQ